MSKLRKFFLVSGVILIGAIVITVIDKLLGINFVGVSPAARITHVVVYGLWGAIIAWTVDA